jgi:superfamily II DNA or RNA helicase
MQIKLRPHQERGDVAMQQYNKGQLIYPTGGGKTLNMIMDAVREFQSATPQTIVVVAPRILLAEQLSSEFLEHIVDPMVRVLHVHSGETHHESTTNPAVIYDWAVQTYKRHRIIFTTYNSLQSYSRVLVLMWIQSTLDEAHNSVKRNFFPATENFCCQCKSLLSSLLQLVRLHSLTLNQE